MEKYTDQAACSVSPEPCATTIRSCAMYWSTDDAHICNVVRTFACLILFEKFFGGCTTTVKYQLETNNCPEGETYRASSNSSRPFSNIFSFLYCSTNAFLLRNRSNWSIMRLKSCYECDQMRQDYEFVATAGRTEATLVWLANIKPLTRWLVATYGDLRVSATWMDAGPHGMKFASWRSRIRSNDWWT